MRTLVIGLVWLATVAAAFHLGRTLAREDAPADGVERAAVREASPPPADPYLAPAPAPARGPEENSRESEVPAGPARPAPEAIDALPPFTLEGVTSGDEAMARLRRYIDAYLAEGKEGHRNLLRFLNDHVIENKALEAFMRNDQDSVRLLYPWLRFLVHREGDVVAAVATAYETMATDPSFFDEFDNDTIELFTEGMAMMLPGAVDDEGLEPFRNWAQQILDTDETLQPAALRRQRKDLERALAIWAPRLTPEQAIARIRAGTLSGRAALPVLTTLSPDQLQGLDLGSLLVDAVRQGDHRVIQALRDLPLTGRDLDLLDQAILDGGAPWAVHSYLHATRRLSWPAAQGLVERGLALRKGTDSTYALVLSRCDPKPPADYVAWVIDTYEIDEAVVKNLKAQFDLR